MRTSSDVLVDGMRTAKSRGSLGRGRLSRVPRSGPARARIGSLRRRAIRS